MWNVKWSRELVICGVILSVLRIRDILEGTYPDPYPDIFVSDLQGATKKKIFVWVFLLINYRSYIFSKIKSHK
jgi:hypothetical protein